MTNDLPADPEALAKASAEHMYARDHATQGLGIQLIDVGPGTACMQMRVRPDMLNGHAMCHGGFIFTLADSTFAFACNSYNLQTVAAGCTIEFLAPAKEGELLQAVAIEQARSGKTGVYDVSVTTSDGKKIALMRGKSHQISGPVIQDV